MVTFWAILENITTMVKKLLWYLLTKKYHSSFLLKNFGYFLIQTSGHNDWSVRENIADRLSGTHVARAYSLTSYGEVSLKR